MVKCVMCNSTMHVNLQSYHNFVSLVHMLPSAQSLCLSICLSITCIAFHPLFCSQVFANRTASFCLQSACHSHTLFLNDNIPTGNSLLTLTPNPQPLHSPLLTPLLPFMTVKSFTSPSLPFLVAGNPPSNMHSDEPDSFAAFHVFELAFHQSLLSLSCL